MYEGTSKCSGDFVVEDVDAAGDTFRRLIFLDNQFLVQSEAKMKTGMCFDIIAFAPGFIHVEIDPGRTGPVYHRKFSIRPPYDLD